jgi:hypothetical protein
MVVPLGWPGGFARIVLFSEVSVRHWDAGPARWSGWRFPALSSPFLALGETRFCMARCGIMRP